MGSKRVNYSITPHMNHRAISEHVFANILFFEDHLKGVLDFPSTPKITANLKTKDGIPSVVLAPEKVDKIAKVEIYYSVDPHILTRFWRTAKALRKGCKWNAKLPLTSTEQPLYIMANVYYALEHHVVGYPWVRKAPETFGVSSEMISYTPDQLKQAQVKAEYTRKRLIEKDFDDYQDWYQLDWGNPNWWSAYTRKIKDPMYAGPDGAKLILDLKVDHDVTIFVELQDNNWNAYPGEKKGQYYATLNIKRSDKWQSVGVTVADFKPVHERTKHPLKSWRHVTEIGIRGRMAINQGGKRVELPGKGDEPHAKWPTPRAMRNLRWEGGP